MGMKYRPEMTQLECDMLMRELNAIDQAFAEAIGDKDFDVTNEMDELRKAALNHRGQP